jgi:hypothetical protein
MALLGFIATTRAQDRPRSPTRKVARWAMMGLGLAIMAVGIPFLFLPLPLHLPAILVIAAGLVIVLRNSFTARRHFIKAQRRHPKIVFPLRRLMRREPEVAPVFWQQTLRFEALVLPRRVRFCRRVRIVVMRRKRRG